MGNVSLPFYSRPFHRYVFLQGLLCVSLFLLCISSMTDPDAVHTVHNRLVVCNRSKVSEKECEEVTRILGRLRAREIIIWTHHLTFGVLSCFSGSIAILAWATHAKTWTRLEKQRVVYWCAPFISCLILLIQVFVALFFTMPIRAVYLFMSVMASGLVLWDGFHFAASLQELLPEPTQSSETPPSKRTPIKPPASLDSTRPSKKSLPPTASSTFPQKASPAVATIKP